jgi:uncharacterized protein (DUF3084 family)
MDNYEEVSKISLLEALKSAETSMPKTHAEKIERLQLACQEKDEQIADQATDIKELEGRLHKAEEIFREYVKERDLELATKTRLLMSTVRGFSDMIAEQAALIQKLEEAVLKLYINDVCSAGMPRENAEFHAKEALEKIKGIDRKL